MNAELVRLCQQKRWDEVWEIVRVSSLDWCANLSLYMERQGAELRNAAPWRRFTRALQLFPIAKGANLRLEVPTHKASAAMLELANFDWTRDSTGVQVAIQTRPISVWNITTGQQIQDIPELIDPGSPPTASQMAWVPKENTPKAVRSVAKGQLILMETQQGTWSFTPNQSHFWRGMRIAQRPWARDRGVLRSSSGALILDPGGLSVQELYIGCNRDIFMAQNGEILVDSFRPTGPETVQLFFSKASSPTDFGQLTDPQKSLIELCSKQGDPISDFFAAILAISKS